MTFPFKIPFATSGNQTAIPETDLSGFVNFTDGYTPDYQLDPETDPNGKVIERDKWNWLFNRITAAIGEAQQNGCAEWYSEFSPYGLGSVVSRAGKIWQSTIANNSTEPGDVGANWVDITALAATETDYGRVILATQADAEPATIGAANNTKAATILRVFQALRSTLANATETMRGTLRLSTTAETRNGTDDNTAVSPKTLNQTAFGLGQSWVDVTTERATGVIYTNTTGKAIFISVSTTPAAQGSVFQLKVNGVNVASSAISSQVDSSIWLSTIVPSGATYEAAGRLDGLWMEYR